MLNWKSSLKLLVIAMDIFCVLPMTALAITSHCGPEILRDQIVPTDAVEAEMFITSHRDRFDLLPQVPSSELKDLSELENDGKTNLGSYEATLNGEDVFIKVVNHSDVREAFWLLYLNRVGLGTHFFGVTPNLQSPRFPDDERYYGIVMKKYEGIGTKSYLNPGRLPEGFVLTQDMISEMRRQALAAYEA
ncbi:MAG: hypothetical protein AAF202_05230, partial [Pseudomonadota bacterium]